MIMRWITICCLAIILAGVICNPVSGAQPIPDFGKILQIHLDHQSSGYSVSAMEVRYGKAPNLDIRTGNLKGVILDTKGNELKSFSFQAPGAAQGDILGPEGGDSLIGFTESPVNGNMIITIPYLQDMQEFSLSDSRDGSLLVSADLSPAVAAFCTDYPYDPDCLARVPAAKSAVPEPRTYLVLAAVLSASVIGAAIIAILTIRRKTKAQIPEKQVVLIVDDEPDLVNLIDLLLDKKGYATLKAFSGKECLDILKKQIPDLILLDVRMEPMDGWQALEQIKKNPETKSIPVLMLTGQRLTAGAAKQYNICIDDYITKPFQPTDLYAAIDNIVARKQKLKDSLVLAKKAGVDKEKFCEFARLSRRISVNKRIIDILEGPEGTPVWADDNNRDEKAVIEHIHVTTRVNEKRVEQLRQEINKAFRSKGLPELSL
jgi:two-component system, OmpR family, response regulator